MTLGTTEQVLVVILAITLAVLLILSVVVAVLFIRVMRQIKRIITKAESIADKADSVTTFFQQTAGPAALAKLVSNIVHSVREKKGKK
jgi:hypothetical protein